MVGFDLSIAGDIEDVEIDLGLRKRRSTPRPSPFGEGEEFPFMLKAPVQTRNRKHQRLVEMIRALAVAGGSTRNVVSTNE